METPNDVQSVGCVNEPAIQPDQSELPPVAGQMYKEHTMISVPPAASVTRTEKVDKPVPVGVPDRTPLVANERPVGNEPDASVQVYGVIPPVAVNVKLYATF